MSVVTTSLTGTLGLQSGSGELKGTLNLVNGSSQLIGKVYIPDSSGIWPYGFYGGSYDVTPLTNSEVVLPSTNKIMQSDVTVRQIPRYDTGNSSGGVTVYIGE